MKDGVITHNQTLKANGLNANLKHQQQLLSYLNKLKLQLISKCQKSMETQPATLKS